MAEAEKMDALKRAYAEMILNTAKEAASRVMASELKARRFEQDLVSTKEEAARLLLRLKEMIDRKTKEGEDAFSNQKRKVDELECQLDEAEGIILELRAELNEAQEQLDQAKQRPVLSSRLSENGKLTYMAAKDNMSGYEQFTEPLMSGPELLTFDGEHFSLDKRSQDVNSECHVYLVDSHQNLSPIEEPVMLRNGCTQAVHTTEMNIVSEDLLHGGKLDPFEDSTNGEGNVGSASMLVDNVPHGKSEDVSVVRRSIRKRKLKDWDEVMSACSYQFKKARLAISSLSCCKSKKVRLCVESGDKLKSDGKTQTGKSLDCVEENPNDELRYNKNPTDTGIELIDVVVKQDELDAMFGLDNASNIDCDVTCAIATESFNHCYEDRERVFKYTFSRKRKDSTIYPENISSSADSPLRKNSGVIGNGISGFKAQSY
ncbi:hypothetical protein F511_20759 [Dorcoceras hygrometricum]|uniref:Uncharacterized protein n=1 Tax=Dorcoceras hygrometricum TaxID=472368 RepID=A0A2Z7A6J3_9LAMI|nr:hypothetical protein F511_20759 [Dorcoceras hygrometricum]